MDSDEIQRLLPGLERSPIPLSDHLNDILRDPLGEILPQDTRYQECFDRFEYLTALVHADMHNEKYGEIWAPVGRFAYRSRRYSENIMNKIQSEFENSTLTELGVEDGVPTKQAYSTWPPLKAGLFGGSAERFKLIKEKFDELAGQVSRSRW